MWNKDTKKLCRNAFFLNFWTSYELYFHRITPFEYLRSIKEKRKGEQLLEITIGEKSFCLPRINRFRRSWLKNWFGLLATTWRANYGLTNYCSEKYLGFLESHWQKLYGKFITWSKLDT